VRDLVAELAVALRERVLPALGSHAARAHVGSGGDGDVNFAIDEDAEWFLEQFLSEHAPGVAYFSEHRGLVEPAGGAEHVLIVDPVDGTRPALAGFESSCVSVAAAPLGDGGPAMADVEVAAVVEIKSGMRFVAQRGSGVECDAPVALSANESLELMFWAYGLRGRPARPTTEVLAELIDASSVGGASFDLGSASYDITRIVTGQLDAYVEPAPRLVEEIPGMREQFERVGGGAILNNTPYDLAGAALCLQEAGGFVTDACGEPLDRRPLLGSGPEHQMSIVAASNSALHQKILTQIDAGLARLAT
jgi:myo-inositol-1(or 4)-monophosphatase